jgi:hypothetical protein
MRRHDALRTDSFRIFHEAGETQFCADFSKLTDISQIVNFINENARIILAQAIFFSHVKAEAPFYDPIDFDKFSIKNLRMTTRWVNRVEIRCATPNRKPWLGNGCKKIPYPGWMGVFICDGFNGIDGWRGSISLPRLLDAIPGLNVDVVVGDAHQAQYGMFAEEHPNRVIWEKLNGAISD